MMKLFGLCVSFLVLGITVGLPTKVCTLNIFVKIEWARGKCKCQTNSNACFG